MFFFLYTRRCLTNTEAWGNQLQKISEGYAYNATKDLSSAYTDIRERPRAVIIVQIVKF